MLAFALAVVAMLGAPLLQGSAEAQGRGGGRIAIDGRGDGRVGGRAGLRPRTAARRVVPAPHPASRAAGAPQRDDRAVAPGHGGIIIGGYYQPPYYS